MKRLPRALVYCQHAVGIGHLMRLLRLLQVLNRDFDVTLLSGGHWPGHLAPPPGIRVIQLPPLQLQAYQLVADSPTGTLPVVKRARRRAVLQTLHDVQPDLLLVELYPFGRKKFAFELLPLLISARRLQPAPRIVCSLRDILVDTRHDQQRHDDRAAKIMNRYFDAAVVHADPAFAVLSDSFRPAQPLVPPVHYTGFVAPGDRHCAARDARDPTMLVSVGGGRVGSRLLGLALEAHLLLPPATRPRLKLVVGPLGTADRVTLFAPYGTLPADVEVVDTVADLRAEMARAAYSLSQGGYNTIMDIFTSGVRALVVPYAEGRENEQEKRAQRLATLGLVQTARLATLTPAALAAAFERLRTFEPHPCRFNLEGAGNTARILREMAACRAHGFAA